MFDTDSDGNLIYVPEDASADDAPGDGLFDAPGDALDGAFVPPEDDAVPEDVGDGEDVPVTAPFFTGSGNSPTGSGDTATVPVPGLSVESGDVTLTTSGDVYIYPDVPDAEAAALDADGARSVYSANVLGLPNTTSVSYLEDVAAGYPSWYKYMAFKTDDSYAQSMCLWIGPDAEKSQYQDRIDFSGGVDCIQVNYVRNGSYSSYYEYQRSHYDSYQIPYGSNVFLYTNVVDGYAEMDVPQGFRPSWAVLIAVAVFLVLGILKGGGRQ